MAERKKTGATKKTAAEKRRAASQARAKTMAKKTRGVEIRGIILIALGLFLATTFFTDATGAFGHYFKEILMGLFGGPAVIFFVFLIWTGITLFLEKKSGKAQYKVWLLFAFMVVASVMWAIFCENTEWTYDSFISGIKEMYFRGIDGDSGVIGTLLCVGIVKCIGTVGTTILSVALLLILFVLLTEVSIEKLFKRIALWFKKNKENIAKSLDEEIDMEIEEKADSERKGLFGRKKKEKTEKTVEGEPAQADAIRRKSPNSDYFDVYFSGQAIGEVAKSTSVPKKRFKFEDEADETQEAIREVLEKHSAEDKGSVIVADSSSGVLTNLPGADGTFKEENGEFEPPSLVQMEERVDPLTQAALDSGVPMDRAVEAGKRLSQQEVLQAANSVDAAAKENIEATKLINYKLPSVSLLAKPKPKTKSRAEIKHELEDKANRLLETLASFKVDAKIINITQGPSVTRFELQPGFGIKVSKITNLADDIALSLAASGVRIEAPIPGKSAIGIEIPNETPSPVPIREVIDSDKFREFKSKTAFALGKDIAGNCVVADIANFPHVLIAGATGSGKSVCINSLITSILYKAKPNEVKMIMVDPKMVELGVYNGIPHLLIPVVTDPKHAAGALNWAVAEMKNRYQLMKDNKVRNLMGYNELMEEMGTPENKLPEIVIIIDELADLMLAAKNEVEDAINSLAALARAAGMYLVIATQRPSVDVITGVIKANVPSRISFAVSSQVDSRTILDSMGAEKLLGKGDMLYAPRGAVKPIRIQGNFLSDEEIEGIISYIKKQYEAVYDESILEHIEREQESNDDSGDDDSHTRSGEKDELFWKAAELAFESGQASVAMLQRKYKVGYQRAARIIDQLEENRIIGPYEGTKPRQVLISRAELNEMIMNNSDR
ncbi:MAG: DNA translocase FtsK [Clostridia bacterium]|nr:DNA translocase FtsK [Clostridia bacterium]